MQCTHQELACVQATLPGMMLCLNQRRATKTFAHLSAHPAGMVVMLHLAYSMIQVVSDTAHLQGVCDAAIGTLPDMGEEQLRVSAGLGINPKP